MSNASPVGRTIAHYRILDTVGRGGMAIVYLAEDLRHHRKVAVKVLRPELAAVLGQERFLREITTTANLRHPNILPLYDSGKGAEDESGSELLYYVMPYVEGESLRDRLNREKQLPVDEALQITREVAEALAYAHDRGVVHRDIKPENILLESGHAVVADFGIARAVDAAGGAQLTATGLALGTPAYMSPEQAAGERELDGRSDVYALGCVLYEMLAGRPPFSGPTMESLVRQHLTADVPSVTTLRPRVPDQVAAALNRALAKVPADRYQSATRFIEAVQPSGAGPALAAAGVQPPASADTWPRLLLWAGAAVVLAAGIVLWRGGTTGRESLSGPRTAVLPFAPAAADSALERMGRDLVVTLTAGLDGMGELRTIDALTTLAQVQPRKAFSLDDAHELARRLHADRFIHGALTRAGTGLRLDASLYSAGAAEPMARTSVTADDLPALSDAATIALLDHLWQTEPPLVPSLAAVTKSAVPAARRAYLAGELALSRHDMPAAIEAFELAFAADTTFWWAYWRSLYPRSYRETASPDRALIRKVVEHRSELPEPDRLLIEASYTLTSRNEQLERLRQLTERFPHYEPGWWDYANMLAHSGGYHGHTTEDTRAALERVLTLNPRFVPAWDHLQWVAIAQGDSVTVARATFEATQLVDDAGSGAEANIFRHSRAQFFYSKLLSPDSVSRIVELALESPPGLVEALALGPMSDGASAVQVQLNRAVRERATSSAMVAALWQGETLAWAARGAWDSALVASDNWARAAGRPDGAVGAYRLAVAGVMLGALRAHDALRRRPALGMASRWSSQERADLAWLDGVLAYLEQDPQRIASARRALAADSSVVTSFLERSLAALAVDAAGDRVRAARALVELEAEIADRGLVVAVGRTHPTATITNRLLATRWLRSLGENAEAARLLNWHETIVVSVVLAAWNRSIGRISLLDRAEIAESSGDSSRARLDFERFLRQYDLPVPALRPQVARAEAGMERLARAPRQ